MCSAFQKVNKESPRLRGGIGAVQGHGDVGLEEAEAAAAIVTLTSIAERMEGFVTDHSRHCISELYFASGAGLMPVEMVEHLRQQHVTADQG